MEMVMRVREMDTERSPTGNSALIWVMPVSSRWTTEQAGFAARSGSI